jgi:hypothetical protein
MDKNHGYHNGVCTYRGALSIDSIKHVQTNMGFLQVVSQETMQAKLFLSGEFYSRQTFEFLGVFIKKYLISYQPYSL